MYRCLLTNSTCSEWAITINIHRIVAILDVERIRWRRRWTVALPVLGTANVHRLFILRKRLANGFVKPEKSWNLQSAYFICNDYCRASVQRDTIPLSRVKERQVSSGCRMEGTALDSGAKCPDQNEGRQPRPVKWWEPSLTSEYYLSTHFSAFRVCRDGRSHTWFFQKKRRNIYR